MSVNEEPILPLKKYVFIKLNCSHKNGFVLNVIATTFCYNTDILLNY